MDRGSKSVVDDEMVLLNFNLICRISVAREFRRVMGMVMLNSASRSSNVLVLATNMWPRGFVWKSWPTVLRPA